MKRIGGLVLTAACIGVLSSCSSPLGPSASSHGLDSGISSDFSGGKSGGDSAVSGVADVTAAGEEEKDSTDSGAVRSKKLLPAVGSFDSTSPEFEIFDPCVEISEEDLHRLGFEERMPSGVRESGLSHCGFEYVGGGGEKTFVGLGVTDLAISEIAKIYEQRTIYEGKRLPAIAFEDQNFSKLFCTLYLETAGGTITLNASGGSFADDEMARCEFGEEIFVKLMEGNSKNGNQPS